MLCFYWRQVSSSDVFGDSTSRKAFKGVNGRNAIKLEQTTVEATRSHTEIRKVYDKNDGRQKNMLKKSVDCNIVINVSLYTQAPTNAY